MLEPYIEHFSLNIFFILGYILCLFFMFGLSSVLLGFESFYNQHSFSGMSYYILSHTSK